VAMLSLMCRMALLEQMGCGLSALGSAVKGSLRLFQVKVSKASKTAKRVRVFAMSMRLGVCTFSLQRKAACSVVNRRYLKQNSRNISLIIGKKGYEQKNMSKVMITVNEFHIRN